MEQRIIAGILDRAEGAFELYADRRISLTVLHVNLDRLAADMKVFDPEVAEALGGFRDRIAHIGVMSERPWMDALDVKRDFRAWRRRMTSGEAAPPTLRLVPENDDDVARRAAASEVESITQEYEPIISPDELIEH